MMDRAPDGAEASPRVLVTGASGYVGGRPIPELLQKDFRVRATAPDGTIFHQRAVFHPQGLLGEAYWWAVWPFHGIVFGGMQRNIARAAAAADTEERTS